MENIEQLVKSTYDSVNLINQLKQKEELSQDDIDTINRNKEHISIMLSDEEFYNALTHVQLEELQEIIK